MKKLFLLAGLGVLLTACGVTHPPLCEFGAGDPFAMTFSLKSTSSGPAGCGAELEATLNENAIPYSGDSTGATTLRFALWGFEQYYSQTDSKLRAAAARPGEYAGVAIPGVNGAPAGPSPLLQGSFRSAYPDAKHLCYVDDFGTVTNGTTTYTGKNFQIYVDVVHPGTQLTGEVTYTAPVTGGTCTAVFDVLSVYPGTHCRKDADCDPCPSDAASEYLFGSGVAADYSVTCQHISAGDLDKEGRGLCMLSPGSTFPAIQSKAKACVYKY